MQGAVSKLIDFSKEKVQGTNDFCIGQLIDITPQGRAIVDFQDNPDGPVEARSIISELPENINILLDPPPVILIFENGNPKRPIIIGLVSETLLRSSNRNSSTWLDERPKEAMIDGQRIEFDAEDEIILRCGKSSVTLRKNGRIIVKGVEITSRAARSNKIKGASVSIN